MKEEIIEFAEPQAPTEISDSDTQNSTNEKEEIFIPVKFNKEIKNLTVDEAANLAQKGMKFDLISKELELLKSLALKEGKSISQYLISLENANTEKRKAELSEKCSQDAELVDKILELENLNSNDDNGFAELKECFPQFKSTDDLPEKVRESAKLKGTLLLDEYLRYRLAEKKEANQRIKAEEDARKSSIGSQLSKKGSVSPETEQFIKGLWR